MYKEMDQSSLLNENDHYVWDGKQKQWLMINNPSCGLYLLIDECVDLESAEQLMNYFESLNVKAYSRSHINISHIVYKCGVKHLNSHSHLNQIRSALVINSDKKDKKLFYQCSAKIRRLYGDVEQEEKMESILEELKEEDCEMGMEYHWIQWNKSNISL